MEDAALVAAAAGGDKSAFAAIYDRYADAVHDFCWSVLRDRDEAADIMQDTFLIAARQLSTLREPSKLRSWLFAIARHEAIRRGKKLARAVPTEGVGEMEFDRRIESAVDVDLDRGAVQTLVWDAAAGLSDRDRAILDLHLRQGLEGQDLADALGVSASQSYVLMSRLRDQVERSLGALLVARMGNEDCADLQEVLQGWDGKFTPIMRKRVARHVDRCEVCTEHRKSLVSPLALLSATPALAAPAALRERVFGKIELTAASRPPRGWRGDGFPPGDGAGRRGPLLAAVAAVIVVLAVGVGVVAAGRAGDGGRVETAGGPTTTTISVPSTTTVPVVRPPETTAGTSTSTTTSTTEPVQPGRLVVGGDVGLGDGTSGWVTITNGGGQLLSWTASSSQPWLSVSPASGTLAPGASRVVAVNLDRDAAPEGDVAAVVPFDAAAAGSGAVAVTAYVTPQPPVITNVGPSGKVCESYTWISAVVTDESALTVTVDWTDGKAKGNTTLTLNEGVWSGQISGYSDSTVTYTVSAVDQWGATAKPVGGSFDYVVC